MMLTILLFSAVASADITYVENFETDTVGQNPIASWYFYTENNTEWSNVTDEVAHDGTKSFLINDSLQEGGDGNVDFALEIQYPYDSFEFYFLMHSDDHNYTMIRLMDNARTNTICFINITNTTVYVNNSADILPTIYSTAISNDTWYGLHIDFNWSDDTVFVQFLNTGGTVVDDSSSWIDMGDPASGYDFTEYEYFNMTVPNGSKVWLALDGFSLVKPTSGSGGTTSSFSINYLLIIALSLLVLFLVWDLIKNPSLEVTLIVLFLVAVIVVTVGIEIVSSIG